MNEKKDFWSKLDVIGKILSGILLPAVIFVIGTKINLQQKANDENQKKIDRVTSIIQSLSSDNKRERELSLEFAKHLANTGQFPEELYPVFINVINAEPNIKLAQEATEILEVVAQTNPELNKKIESIKSDKTPIVYIQYQNDSSISKALKAQEILLEKGYKAPGIEHIGHASLTDNDIRYFHKDPVEVQTAINIKELLEPVIGTIKANDMSAKYGNKVKSYTYEVWIK